MDGCRIVTKSSLCARWDECLGERVGERGRSGAGRVGFGSEDGLCWVVGAARTVLAGSEDG